MSLVLDLIYSTLSDPVDGMSQVRVIKLLSFHNNFLLGLVSEQFLVLFLGPVGELVVAYS